MRKLQNIISNFGIVIARQGNKLVARIETLRSLRASSITLFSYVSELALELCKDAWQGPSHAWSTTPRNGTATSFASANYAVVKRAVVKRAVVKRAQRRHQIMCHRTAA